METFICEECGVEHSIKQQRCLNLGRWATYIEVCPKCYRKLKLRAMCNRGENLFDKIKSKRKQWKQNT